MIHVYQAYGKCPPVNHQYVVGPEMVADTKLHLTERLAEQQFSFDLHELS